MNIQVRTKYCTNRKKVKDLGVGKQDILPLEKHIDNICGNTFMMLKNIWMAFHSLDKDMMRNITTSMTRLKLKYAEAI